MAQTGAYDHCLDGRPRRPYRDRLMTEFAQPKPKLGLSRAPGLAASGQSSGPLVSPVTRHLHSVQRRQSITQVLISSFSSLATLNPDYQP